MLRWTCGKTMLDMIPDGVFRIVLEVESMISKMREGTLRWFGCVRKRPQQALVRRVEALIVDGRRRMGRPKLRFWFRRFRRLLGVSRTPISLSFALGLGPLSDDLFRGVDEELSDGGSLRVIVYGYDRLPMQPVASPSLDYVPRPEYPPSPDYMLGLKYPPSPIEIPYVLEQEYPEYLVPYDAEAPLEDQPLLTDASPTAASPGYVVDFDPDEDPEEDPEEDHVDYPADGGDGDDDPSDDDDDDDDTDDEDEEPFKDEEYDEEEKEEHLPPADSSAVPIVDPVPPAGDIEAFENDEFAPTPRPPYTIIPFFLKHVSIRHGRLSDLNYLRQHPWRHKACLTTPALGFDVRESYTAGAARQPWPALESNHRRYRVKQTDREATYARRAWVGFEDRSAEAHVRTLKEHVATLIAQTLSLQTQLTTALGHIKILEARDPEPQEGPAETGSSS
uniref:Putative reverse transcriptase domain, nucleoporin, Nup155-like protein n=1 Tax=Tanacetum cinerariifolium TaxID=118510 RepID=A0A6L2LD16_TANCI|nr:putative reverse transcriptase domain, nucleoporin, Nup155-like protein [Tanacetum cinerariifolium]